MPSEQRPPGWGVEVADRLWVLPADGPPEVRAVLGLAGWRLLRGLLACARPGPWGGLVVQQPLDRLAGLAGVDGVRAGRLVGELAERGWVGRLGGGRLLVAPPPGVSVCWGWELAAPTPGEAGWRWRPLPPPPPSPPAEVELDARIGVLLGRTPRQPTPGGPTLGR